MLKIFLPTSSRGETSVLVLDTKNKAVTNKYKSVEPVDGKPDKPRPSTRKSQNPVTVRRSQLWLETFIKKKVEEKASNDNQQALDKPAAGASVLELSKKEDIVATGLPSHILQVDGETEEDEAKFFFESSYHEDDVMDTLEDIFLESEVDLTLEFKPKCM